MQYTFVYSIYDVVLTVSTMFHSMCAGKTPEKGEEEKDRMEREDNFSDGWCKKITRRSFTPHIVLGPYPPKMTGTKTMLELLNNYLGMHTKERIIMGCIESKNAEFVAKERERQEASLKPPSKVMDSSKYGQELLMLVRQTLEAHLEIMHLDHLKATQMITRSVRDGNDGTMYYIKAETALSDCPWIFGNHL